MTDHPNNNRGRFKKGTSGNPKGRPKGAASRKTVLEAECGEMIHVTENGKRRKITKWEAFIKQVVNKAVAGDLRAADILLKHVSKYGGWMMDTKAVAENVVHEKAAPAAMTLDEVARIYREAVKNAKPT